VFLLNNAFDVFPRHVRVLFGEPVHDMAECPQFFDDAHWESFGAAITRFKSGFFRGPGLGPATCPSSCGHQRATFGGHHSCMSTTTDAPGTSNPERTAVLSTAAHVYGDQIEESYKGTLVHRGQVTEIALRQELFWTADYLTGSRRLPDIAELEILEPRRLSQQCTATRYFDADTHQRLRDWDCHPF
jgi:hypothetical protein